MIKKKLEQNLSLVADLADDTHKTFSENNIREWKLTETQQAILHMTISSLFQFGKNPKSSNFLTEAEQSPQVIFWKITQVL